MDYDLIVIGGGPGGYAVAVRAAQAGLQTALIEARPHLGGTCLNVGCIPSKALLASSELYAHVVREGSSHGLKMGRLTADVKALMERKDGVVRQLRQGIAQVVGSKVEVLHGRAVVEGDHAVAFKAAGKGKAKSGRLSAKAILLATGSEPVELPCVPFNGKWVVGSDEGIAFPKAPRKLVVVGAGAIGLELGSVWARLGSEVVVVEALDRIAVGFDEDVAVAARRIFEKQDIAFELSSKITGFQRVGSAGVLHYERGGRTFEIEASKVLVCVGRKPAVREMVGASVELSLDERGCVDVNEHFETHVEGVYAIGDLVRGPMLAHKAEAEGVAFVDRLLGKPVVYRRDLIPNVIYTHPEMASVGLGEATAKEKGLSVVVGKAFFKANGRALSAGDAEGFVKVIVEASSDRLLGCQILGSQASELIAIASAHLEYGGSAEDIACMIFAHPTLSETLRDAAKVAFAKSAL